jgi:NAD(P)H dehydrogenase (quinone)
MRLNVIFYSTYGHMYQMAQAAVEGAKSAGADVGLYRVQELIPEETLKQIGAFEAQKAFEDVPIATNEALKEADAFVFGVPTRFGNMSSQFRSFWDQTGELWANGSLIGKPAGVMSSTATQHGGQESTILTTHVTLLHHGMIIVGLPYSFQGQTRIDEITGASPYGASTIAGGQGERMPSENELEGARFQARRVAELATKLVG